MDRQLCTVWANSLKDWEDRDVMKEGRFLGAEDGSPWKQGCENVYSPHPGPG